MEEFEFEIKKMMSGESPVDASKVKEVGEEVVRAYDRKKHKVRVCLYVWMAVICVFLALSAYWFFRSSDLKACLGAGVLFLVMYESTVLMKLWYWVVDSKIATVRELKLVQLQLAELAAKVNGRPEGK